MPFHIFFDKPSPEGHQMGHRWHRGRETWRLACRLPTWATVCSSPHSSRHTSNQSTAICWNRDLAITCSGKGRSENFVTPPFEQPTCKNKSIFFKFEFWKCESKNKKRWFSRVCLPDEMVCCGWWGAGCDNAPSFLHQTFHLLSLSDSAAPP